MPERSGRRRARCEAALRLHGEGVPIKDIARRLSASRNGVRRWAARRRQGEAARPPSARIPSTRRITRWLTSDPAALSQADRHFTEALRAIAPSLKVSAEHARAFAGLLRQGDTAGLDPWLEAAATTELRGCATGLKQDKAAVRAAIAEPWSNGPVEEQVNRLKLIKRSM